MNLKAVELSPDRNSTGASVAPCSYCCLTSRSRVKWATGSDAYAIPGSDSAKRAAAIAAYRTAGITRRSHALNSMTYSSRSNSKPHMP